MASFYESAARVLDVLEQGRSSLKAIVDKQADDASAARRLLALCVSSLEYRAALEKVLDASELLKLERAVFRPPSAASRRKAAEEGAVRGHAATRPTPRALALVLVHDLLCSRGISASASWPPRAAVERHKARLKAEIIKVQLREGKSRIDQLRLGADDREKAARVPRWARVNEGIVSVDDVLRTLEAAGWKNVAGPTLEKGRTFTASPHIPAVLAFHPSSTSALLADPLYKSGKLILQDLASCMPAWILLGGDPLPLRADDMLIDATSAPGNKTSHMSSLVHRRCEGAPSGGPRITAFEHSPQRFKTLTSLLSKAGALHAGPSASKTPTKRKHDGSPSLGAGAHNVHAVLADFLTADPTSAQWSSVTHMILDPSCSGSGIMGRMDYLQTAAAADDDDEEGEGENDTPPTDAPGQKQAERLAKLGDFQLRMINSAMRFPALRRLTYSTCSVHAEENEHVVLRALDSPEARESGWRIAPRAQVVPTWRTRGLVDACGGDAELADCVLRCVPGGDPAAMLQLTPGQAHVEATNGFFVACFVRGEQPERARADGEQAGEEVLRPAKKRKKNKKKKRRAAGGDDGAAGSS